MDIIQEINLPLMRCPFLQNDYLILHMKLEDPRKQTSAIARQPGSHTQSGSLTHKLSELFLNRSRRPSLTMKFRLKADTPPRLTPMRHNSDVGGIFLTGSRRNLKSICLSRRVWVSHQATKSPPGW